MDENGPGSKCMAQVVEAICQQWHERLMMMMMMMIINIHYTLFAASCWHKTQSSVQRLLISSLCDQTPNLFGLPQLGLGLSGENNGY